MTYSASLIFIAAALLEGERRCCGPKRITTVHPIFIVVGFFMLGCYGLVVNLVRWDFFKTSRSLLVAVFALVSVLFGQNRVRRKNSRRHLDWSRFHSSGRWDDDSIWF